MPNLPSLVINHCTSIFNAISFYEITTLHVKGRQILAVIFLFHSHMPCFTLSFIIFKNSVFKSQNHDKFFGFLQLELGPENKKF